MRHISIFLVLTVLFCTFFSAHIRAENFISHGYNEIGISPYGATGNIGLENITSPKEFKNKKFKVFFIVYHGEASPGQVISETYITNEAGIRDSNDYYYGIDKPDLMISPYLKKGKTTGTAKYMLFVVDEDFYVERVNIFDNGAKLPTLEKQKIENMFAAKFMEEGPEYISNIADIVSLGGIESFIDYEGRVMNVKYDVPYVSVRFSLQNWLLIDSYIYRNNVDYSYGYYVNSDSDVDEKNTKTPDFNKQDNKGIGQYLYNRNTGKLVLLLQDSLISNGDGVDSPIMIMGKNAIYLSYDITVGKSGGISEIIELKNNKIKSVFTGSYSGS